MSKYNWTYEVNINSDIWRGELVNSRKEAIRRGMKKAKEEGYDSFKIGITEKAEEKVNTFLKELIIYLKKILKCYVPKDSIYSLSYNEIQKKLDVLNSIDINEIGHNEDGYVYILINNTKENIKKLHSIGFTDDDIAESCGVESFEEIDKEENLNICILTFKYTDYYTNGKFIQVEDI